VRHQRWAFVHCTPASSHSLLGPAALASQVCVCVPGEGGGVFMGGGGVWGWGRMVSVRDW
jgi:hypothetical protein